MNFRLSADLLTWRVVLRERARADGVGNQINIRPAPFGAECKRGNLPPAGRCSAPGFLLPSVPFGGSSARGAGSGGPVCPQGLYPRGRIGAVPIPSTCNSPSGWKKGSLPLPRQGGGCVCRTRMCAGWKCCLDTAARSPGSRGPAAPAPLFPAGRAQAQLGTFPWRCWEPVPRWDPVQDLSPGDPSPKTANPKAASTACISFFPYHLWANSIPESASGGEPEGIFFLLTLLPVPSHNLLCLKQLKELKMPPISLVPSPDGLAGPVHVMAGGALSRPVLRANPGPSRGVGHGGAEHMPGEGKGGWADLNPPLPVCAWLVWRFKASFTGLSAGSFSRVSCYARRSEAAE